MANHATGKAHLPHREVSLVSWTSRGQGYCWHWDW